MSSASALPAGEAREEAVLLLLALHLVLAHDARATEPPEGLGANTGFPLPGLPISKRGDGRPWGRTEEVKRARGDWLTYGRCG